MFGPPEHNIGKGRKGVSFDLDCPRVGGSCHGCLWKTAGVCCSVRRPISGWTPKMSKMADCRLSFVLEQFQRSYSQRSGHIEDGSFSSVTAAYLIA
jgi:hypothetical protein